MSPKRVLRFVLDENVPIEYRSLLPSDQAWTIPESGNSMARDSYVAQYAADHDAVVVTFDSAFAEWMGRHTIASLVYIDSVAHAADILERYRDDLVAILEQRARRSQPVVVKLRLEKLELRDGWSEQPPSV